MAEIDKTGKITEWKQILEFEGRVVTTNNSSQTGNLPGLEFPELLGQYKDKKLKITIAIQLEG